MDDESFEQLFVPVMDTIMDRYQPDAIVLQSGERQLVTPRPVRQSVEQLLGISGAGFASQLHCL
jgi:hypothetical protein